MTQVTYDEAVTFAVRHARCASESSATLGGRVDGDAAAHAQVSLAWSQVAALLLAEQPSKPEKPDKPGGGKP